MKINEIIKKKTSTAYHQSFQTSTDITNSAVTNVIEHQPY